MEHSEVISNNGVAIRTISIFDTCRSQWSRSLKAWVCSHWLAGVAGSNPPVVWISGSCDFCVLPNVVCRE